MTDDLKYTEEDMKNARKESEFQATVLSTLGAIRTDIKNMDARMTTMELHKADKTVITSWESALASANKKVEEVEKRTEDLEKLSAKLTGALFIICGVWALVSAIIVAWLTKFV